MDESFWTKKQSCKFSKVDVKKCHPFFDFVCFNGRHILKMRLRKKGWLENFHILVLKTPYTIEEVGTSLISWTFFLTQLYFKRGV